MIFKSKDLNDVFVYLKTRQLKIKILISITGNKFSSPTLGSEFCLGVGEHGFSSMWQITLQDVPRI